MKLKTFRHLWGVTEPFANVFPAISKAGYDGIEFKSIKVAADPQFKKLLLAYNFSFIAQIHTQGESVEEHIDSFRQLIETALPLNPVLINSQSGKDSWGEDEKHEFITRALAIEASFGIPVAHETHRGRITYNPWDTRELLRYHPNLRLCCDFSHWVNVCERLIDSEESTIRLCAEHCIHVHSRVGYEQGPQVPDPRASEYERHLLAHERWWDIIWNTQQKQGCEISTITPEFGPPDYHHTLPYSRKPVSDLTEICDWMAVRQKQRFHQTFTNNNHDKSGRNYSKPGLLLI